MFGIITITGAKPYTPFYKKFFIYYPINRHKFIPNKLENLFYLVNLFMV